MELAGPCLAGVETGAGRGLFGVITLERLEFQVLSILDTTEGGFLDDAIASGIDVVHATSDFVVATDLDFDGRVGGCVVFAHPFVLEGFRAFDPRASESAFDYASAVGLSASGGADVGLASIDGAFVEDVVFGVSVTIVQTFATCHATGGFGHNLLATGAGAVVPVFSNFEGVTSVVLFAVFHASDLDQFAAIVDGFLAFEESIFFGYLLFLVDAFSGVDASFVGHHHLRFGAGGVEFAFEEVGSVIEDFFGLVLLTVTQAARGFEGQCVTSGNAFTTVVFVVVIASDRDFGKIFGDAGLGHDGTTLANVDETSAFNFGSLSVSAGATAAGCGVSGLSQSHRGRQ